MSVLHRFMLFLKTQSTEDFIESMITCFAAPVVAGLKCGQLINLSRSGECVPPVWNAAKTELLSRLSLDAVDLSSTERSVLVLLYKRDLMRQALASDDAKKFLSSLGYCGACDAVEPHMQRLRERFRSGCPHEIGVFLGYPLEDVRGFIENKGENAKLTGYWKVYGDETRAMEKFRAYKKAEIASARSLLQKAGAAIPSLQRERPAA